MRTIPINLCAAALAALALATVGSVHGRDTTPPPSRLFDAAAIESVMAEQLEPVFPEQLLAEDAAAAARGEEPRRFALPADVAITPANHGTWELLGDGGRLWRLRVAAPNATDLNFGFTSFRLPPGATLHLVSEDHEYFQGPYDAQDNRAHGELWTPVIPGERAVIELYLPPHPAFEPELELGRIGRGYRDLFAATRDLAKQGSCNIDVVCSGDQGYPWVDEWRAEIQSTAVYSLSGFRTCSGAMIIDQPRSFTPYFLTAYHCDVTEANDQTVVTYWNYHSPTCGELGGGTLSQSLSGAMLKASREDVDFCLLELEESPPLDYHVYWAGWDRRTGNVPRSSVTIHHPGADEKAISLNDDPLTLAGNPLVTTPPDTHWRVDNWEQGTTEQGSSGGGLWDPETHLLVGSLTGGSASCAFPAGSDYYGRLAQGWNGDSAQTRLSDWLDPSGTGVETVAGKFASGAGGHFSCGNSGYDSDVAETAAYFGGNDAHNPDYMFAVRFELSDFGYAPGEVEIAGFCASNQLAFTGGPWPNEVFIYPDDGGLPDDSRVLGQGTVTTGDGAGDSVVMLDEPVTLDGDFWLVNRGDPKHAGEDFNMEFDAGPNTGHSLESSSGIGNLTTDNGPDGFPNGVNYMLRAYLQPAGTGPTYTYLVAGISRTSGLEGSDWHSKVALLNRSGGAATATLSYIRDTVTTTAAAQVADGQLVAWEDVLVDLFGLAESSSGALKVDSSRPLLVTTRTYNQQPEGSYGQFVPGVTSEEALATGRTGVLSQLVKTAAFRTNIGFVNLTGVSCQARVRLRDAAGAQVGATREVAVGPYGFAQDTDIFRKAGAGTHDNAYATIEVLTAGCRLWGYGSVIDGESGDPMTIPIRVE